MTISAHTIYRFGWLLLGAVFVLGLLQPTALHAATTTPTLLTKNLSAGDKGPEVTLLQMWLAADRGTYPEKKASGVYDAITVKAVETYQKRRGLITSAKFGGGLGIAGPLTRANLNRDFGPQKGGVAVVEASYGDILRFNGTTFVPLVETRFSSNQKILATVQAWVNPSTVASRDTVLLTVASGYGMGIAPDGKLYGFGPSGRATTESAYMQKDTWHHVSVYFTKKNIVFVVDNKVAETKTYSNKPALGFLDSLLAGVATPFEGFFSPFLFSASDHVVDPVLTVESGATPTVVVTRPSLWSKIVAFVQQTLPLPFRLFVRTEPVPTAQPVPATAAAPSATTTAPAVVATTTKVVKAPTSKPPKIAVGNGTSLFPTAPAIIPKIEPALIPTQILVPVGTTTTVTATTSPTGGSKGTGSTPGVNAAPVITLSGSAQVSISMGATYTDPGATATDAEDGSLTSKIVVGGATVKNDVAGTYVITYNVTDSAGKAATSISRSVTVTPPAALPISQQTPRYQLANAGEDVVYAVSGGTGETVKITSVDINPLHVYVGDTQTMTVTVSSTDGPIASVQAVTKLDTITHTLNLLPTGDGSTYRASWVVYDTHTQIYNTEFTATTNSGSSASVTMAWSDPCTGVTQNSNSSLSSSCAVSVVDGLEGGNLIIPSGVTLTLNAGATWAFNPGKSITITKGGSIVKAAGASLKKGYTFYSGADNNSANTVTKYFFTTPTQTNYVGVASYTQASYYSQSAYYAQSSYYSQSTYYAQSSYYSQGYYYGQGYYQGYYYGQGYYQGYYYGQGYYQSSYYSQGYYYGQGYYQSSYYAEGYYYAQGYYYLQSFYEGGYYAESGYGYFQSYYK